MGIITGKGFLISTVDTDITCPICTFMFDGHAKIAKAKYPVFNTKCPACKGDIVISTNLMGGQTTCYEQAAYDRQTTITANKIEII